MSKSLWDIIEDPERKYPTLNASTKLRRVYRRKDRELQQVVHSLEDVSWSKLYDVLIHNWDLSFVGNWLEKTDLEVNELLSELWKLLLKRARGELHGDGKVQGGVVETFG